MPELPDVEEKRKYLSKTLLNKNIREIEILDDYTIRGQRKHAIKIGVEGKKITEITRRGKYILFSFDSEGVLLLHLGMTGNVTVQSKQMEKPRFTRVVFNLNSNSFYYSDQRKFGRIGYYQVSNIDEIPEIQKLGPEPLNPEFDLNHFKKIIRSHETTIHQILMMQEEISGIGNVYADEICYHSGIRPDRISNDLSDYELLKIYESMKSVLSEAIKLKADLSSHPEKYLTAHRNTDRLCPGEKIALEHKRIGGRTSYWCPVEQK